MIRVLTTAALSLAVFGANPALATANTPYAGQQDRTIAALSAADIEQLLAGGGWGLAKPAELNGWPGPAHVLELSGELSLNEEQRRQVQAIFDRMQAAAQQVGAEYIAAEAALDAAFADGVPLTADQVGTLTEAASARLAELRAVHLAAHLETRPVLTRHQTVLYQRLRGYSEGQGGHTGHGGH